MLTLFMRKIKFYRFENGKCPVKDYLESLSNKQVEKVFFVLDIVEQFNIVPKKFFKKLEATDDIWEVRVQLRKYHIKKSKLPSKEKKIILQKGG